MSTRTVEAYSARDFIRVLRRRKWIVLALAIVVPVAAYFLASRQPVHYDASAQLFVEATPVSSASQNGQSSSPVTAQTDLAQLPVVARAVLEKAHVTDRTPGQLIGSSSVSAVSDSILQFTVSDSDPLVARKLATAFAQTFVPTTTQLTIASLQGAMRQVESKLSGLEAKGVSGGAVYDALVQQRQNLEAETALVTASPFIVKAAPPAAAVGPHPKRDAALGLIVGIVLGIVLAYLFEALDTRVRSEAELEAQLGHLPLLARIPAPRRSRNGQLVMATDVTAPEAEPFRVLRTNLDFVNLSHRARSILMTSAVASEGKSTTISNLALAMARAGRRVILVDLDLRQATLDSYFQIEGAPGLTHVVLGDARLDNALVGIALPSAWKRGSLNGSWNGSTPDAMGSLEVLGAGTLPPNAGEFVGTRAIADLLDELRERADIVLVDAPPLLEVGDAATLSALVDGMLVITRVDTLRRPMVRELRRRLDACPAPKLGLVIHGVTTADEYYSYSEADGAARAASARLAGETRW